MKTFALLLAAISAPGHAAQPGDFRVWGGGLAWEISSYNKPMISWSSDGTARILVAVLSGGVSGVDETSGRAIVDRDNITLCYRIKSSPIPEGQPIPRASYPEILEYTVPGVSESKQYNIELRQDCPGG